MPKNLILTLTAETDADFLQFKHNFAPSLAARGSIGASHRLVFLPAALCTDLRRGEGYAQNLHDQLPDPD